MTSHAFGLIDQSDEDTLHFVRLLNVEERPFQKISKRLLAKDSLLRQFPAQLPTPPPDGSAVDEAAAATEKERQKQEDQRRQWREEVLVDFQLLEDTLIRIQFLQNSNEKERERYAAQKAKILETAQAVRDNTAELRVQLQDAQETLALRKSYDELAEKITRNKMLRSREEQKASLEKLEGEIADLEQEGRDFGTQWAERREQFSRIVDEGQRMLRLIRGEKEDEGKDESMEDAEGAEDGETKGELSATGTPRPDMGGSTPIPGERKASPARHEQAD
ncbi:hypothetical protein H2203_005411 [Taxawa tesnikishii (nom. ined.)]|nr:hypothetical protein H2203_005411 [Dothideales sp. JES 119]